MTTNSSNIKETGDGQFAVEGELSKLTVPAVWRSANGLIKSASQDLVFDLTGVTRTDSAGLALLLEWMTLAHKKGLQIHFRNLPAQLWDIAKVSDLEDIIPLAD